MNFCIECDALGTEKCSEHGTRYRVTTGSTNRMSLGYEIEDALMARCPHADHWYAICVDCGAVRHNQSTQMADHSALSARVAVLEGLLRRSYESVALDQCGEPSCESLFCVENRALLAEIDAALRTESQP